MNKLILLVVISFLAAGCAQKSTKDHQQFVNEIIESLGRDGLACSHEGDRTYCVTADLLSPAPIAAGDSLQPGQDLWICEQIGGSLTGCEPVTSASIHCAGEPGAGGGCRCTGIDSCLKMAEDKACESGSCGDCTGASCCCEYH